MSLSALDLTHNNLKNMKISCLKKRGLNNVIKFFYVLKVFTFFNNIFKYRSNFKFNIIV